MPISPYGSIERTQNSRLVLYCHQINAFLNNLPDLSSDQQTKYCSIAMFIPLNIILTLRGNGDGWDPIKPLVLTRQSLVQSPRTLSNYT